MIEYLKGKNIHEPYIIGETAYHHEGDAEFMDRMIEDIVDMGLNAIKFHLMFNLDSYFHPTHSLKDMTQKWLFSEKQWDSFITKSSKKKLDIIALCDDVESLRYINTKQDQIAGIELHATGLNDYHLLKEAVGFKKTVILGVGGSTLDEIQLALEFLAKEGKRDILLIYGFQSYPTDYAQINLSKLKKLKDLFGLPIGYADHTSFDDPNNEVVSIMAAAMGFNVLEKHYTPELGQKRIDYQSAVGKEQMLRIKELMRLALKVHGQGEIKMSDPELAYGNTGPMKKAIVAQRNISKGETLTFDDLWFKRTEKESPLKQKHFFDLMGLKTSRDIQENEMMDFSMVEYQFLKRKN